MTSALLDAIAESPHDDGPRLVYADWLLQQPDEIARARGEFVALACSTARNAKRSARMKELFDRHQRDWIGPLDPITDPTRRAWSRGFLEGCALTRRGQPPPPVDPAIGHPAWRLMRVLETPGSVIPLDAVHRLITHPVFRNLRSLYIPQSAIDLLAESPYAPQLAELAVAPSGEHLTKMFPLLSSPFLSKLRRLHVFGSGPVNLRQLMLPDLALIVIASPNSLSSWVTELQNLRSPLAELRIVSSVFPLLERRGIELVVKKDGTRWSALEIRWTEENEPKLRDAIIRHLDIAPENQFTRATFIGPTSARFDVARWRHRVVNSLLRRNADIVVDR